MVGVGERSERVRVKQKIKKSQHLKRKMGEQREEDDGKEKAKKKKSLSILEA